MFPADTTSLAADREVLALLRLRTTKAIRIMIMLQAAGQANLVPNHISLESFDPPVRYPDDEEDSDTLEQNAAGVRQRRLPNADNIFKQCIHELRSRRKRQHDTKQYI